MTTLAQTVSIWDRERRWVTLGVLALTFLAGLQVLAITTVMPVVAEDLDGATLYAVAFGGPLATSVIGMVGAGAWSDRVSPRGPLFAAVSLFTIGLLISGLAGDMPTFVGGRLLQGLGTGAETVSLYVVVARVFPKELHARVFAAFAFAWIIPSMVGPFLAGAVAEFLHWRWVFLGVAIIAVLSFLLVLVRLRGVDLRSTEPPTNQPIVLRILLAVVVAAGAVVLGIVVELPSGIGWGVTALAVAVIAVVIVPLIPKGTLRARRGLPSVVLTRALLPAAFLGAEIYIPYLMMDRFDFSPTWAGLSLTVSGLAWAAGAALQGRYGDRLGNLRCMLIAVSLVTLTLTVALVTSALLIPPAALIVSWSVAAVGLGMLYPRLTMLTLAYSAPSDQGFNTSALSLSEAVASSTVIAVMGLAFAASSSPTMAFTTVFAIGAVVTLVSLVPGSRMGHALEDSARS